MDLTPWKSLVLFLATQLSCFPQSAPVADRTVDWIEMLTHPRRLPPDMTQEALSGLAAGPASALTDLVRAMDQQALPVVNWLRSAGDDLLDRAIEQGVELPLPQLEAAARDIRLSAPARRMALLWLERSRAGFADRFLRDQLADPVFASDAVESVERAAAAARQAGRADEATRLLGMAFDATVDPEQAVRLGAGLRELGREVNVHQHLGVVTHWQVLGPFPGNNQQGARTAYPPEQQIDLQRAYTGPAGDMRWKPVALAPGQSFLDLKKAVGPVDDAVAYLFARIRVAESQPAELRGGGDDNLQVWLNGTQVIDSAEYYQRPRLDKHRARLTLRAGENQLLVKVCEVKLPPGPPSGSPPRWQCSVRIVDRNGRGLRFETVP